MNGLGTALPVLLGVIAFGLVASSAGMFPGAAVDHPQQAALLRPAPAVHTGSANATTVHFALTAVPVPVLGIQLTFDATFVPSGGTIDAGYSSSLALDLSEVPDTEVSVGLLNATVRVPIPTLGTFGPYLVPGISYTVAGVALGVSISTRASIDANVSSGPGSGSSVSWNAAGTVAIPAGAPAGAAVGSRLTIAVTDVRYTLSLAVNATGTVPILGSVSYPILPFTPLGSVRGVPSTLTASAGVVAPPSVTGFSATPSTISTGSSTTIAAAIAGGTAPFTFAYEGLPAGCLSANSSSIRCDPRASGTSNVSVAVTDADGAVARATLSFTVTDPPAGGPLGLDGGSGWGFAAIVGSVGAAAVVGGFFLGRARPRRPRPLRAAA